MVSGILLFQPSPSHSHLPYLNDIQQTVTNYLHHVSWNHLLEYLKSKRIFFISKCEEGIQENTSQTFLPLHYVLKMSSTFKYLKVLSNLLKFPRVQTSISFNKTMSILMSAQCYEVKIPEDEPANSDVSLWLPLSKEPPWFRFTFAKKQKKTKPQVTPELDYFSRTWFLTVKIIAAACMHLSTA